MLVHCIVEHIVPFLLRVQHYFYVQFCCCKYVYVAVCPICIMIHIYMYYANIYLGSQDTRRRRAGKAVVKEDDHDNGG